MRVNDSNLAEDLVQETLIKAFANFSKFRGDSTVRTWLFQILRNEISNHFRKKKKERTTNLESSLESSPEELSQLLRPKVTNNEFGTAIEREEFWDVIRICFQKIPEHLLETFLYRLSNPDIKIESLCNELGIKPSNFSVRLFRTRLMLRQCLEQSWMKEE